VQAQDSNEYAQGDKVARALPYDQSHTTADIASYIVNNCKTDQARIRAAYTWVTVNITYDADSIHRVILDEDNVQRITYALKRRKGVCENFAAIFTDICTRMNIPAYAVEGYTRQNGFVDRISHVWCAASINGKWFLYDPTWDAGSLRGGKFIPFVRTDYFQKSPEEFINDHLPFDPIFQFLNYPVVYKDFEKGKSIDKKKSPYFNYEDSLIVYQKSDSLTQYLSSLARIRNSGWPFSRIDTKIKRIKLEIEIIYQDRDMALYNSAVADYNNAIMIMNDFAEYRNHQFEPPKKNEEVYKMFASIRNKITTANQKIKQINSSLATLTLDTGDIQKKLDDLSISVKEQQDFYKNNVDIKKTASAEN
jgi:hypothetical protein